MRGGVLNAGMEILARLVPPPFRQGLIGDLLEEHALRYGAGSPRAARLWLFRQLWRSAPPLLWAAMTRTAWLSTLAAAFVAYVCVGLVEFFMNWAISGSPTGGGAYRPLGMVLTFPAVVLIACAATAYRRGAPWVLGCAMLLAVSVMTLTSAEDVPTGYRIAYFIVGPAAVLLGAALQRKLRRGQNQRCGLFH